MNVEKRILCIFVCLIVRFVFFSEKKPSCWSFFSLETAKTQINLVSIIKTILLSFSVFFLYPNLHWPMALNWWIGFFFFRMNKSSIASLLSLSFYFIPYLGDSGLQFYTQIVSIADIHTHTRPYISFNTFFFAYIRTCRLYRTCEYIMLIFVIYHSQHVASVYPL